MSPSKGRGKFRLIHYPDRCAYCGQCEDSCPSKAIVLINEFVQATPERDALTEVMVERGNNTARETGHPAGH